MRVKAVANWASIRVIVSTDTAWEVLEEGVLVGGLRSRAVGRDL